MEPRGSGVEAPGGIRGERPPTIGLPSRVQRQQQQHQQHQQHHQQQRQQHHQQQHQQPPPCGLAETLSFETWPGVKVELDDVRSSPPPSSPSPPLPPPPFTLLAIKGEPQDAPSWNATAVGGLQCRGGGRGGVGGGGREGGGGGGREGGGGGSGHGGVGGGGGRGRGVIGGVGGEVSHPRVDSGVDAEEVDEEVDKEVKVEVNLPADAYVQVRTVPCPQCDRRFLCRTVLLNHVRRSHPTGPDAAPRHRCDLCPYGTNRGPDMRDHRRTHTGERPFACRVCGRAFAHPRNLPAHVRTHTGERPFACRVCGRGFAQLGTLRRHEGKHGPGK